MHLFPSGRLAVPTLCRATPAPAPRALLGALLLAFLVAACTTTAPPAPSPPQVPEAPQVPAAPPAPQPLSSLPGYAADPLDGLRTALAQQCALPRPPAGWPAFCASLPREGVTSPEALRSWLGERFIAKELVDGGAPDGLVTGYYEPLLTGSLGKERPDQVPLRGPPADLLTIDLAEVEPRLKGMRLRGRLVGQRVVPYYSRAEIGSGKALEQGPVIAWADNAVDAFFLEIQGSGRIRLRDGSILRIGYADQNGHPYRAIGKTLVDRGALQREDVTAPAIRRWLAENPASADDVMRTNPSLVFFRQLPPLPDPDLGPPGALGVPLTPLRSIAVDRQHIPLGSLVYLQTTHPVTGRPMNRLMVAQDTGGAIRGVKRADVFWGFGAQAGHAAGLMKAPARMWVLQPR
jgi:membrane-bound lytic murein transglycosylase A